VTRSLFSGLLLPGFLLAPVLVTPVLMTTVACAHHPLRGLPVDAAVSMPADAAPHPGAQTELWHVHADLTDPEGEPIHVFAGFVAQRTDLDFVGPVPVAWGVNPFHLALVRIQVGDDSWVADRSNFPDLPAARFKGDGLDLRHGDWRIAWEAGALVLEVGAGSQRLDLRLVPTRDPVTPGRDGLVELVPGSRHLWVQQEAMAVQGRLQDGRRTRWVSGTGFAKHQWGRLYDDSLDGFEWISMDLPGDRSLSVAWLQAGGMRGLPGSMAWISDARGEVIPLEDLQVTPIRTWRSRRSGARWPVAWTLEAPEISLTVTADQDDQELWVFPAPMFAGPAHATGELYGEAIDTLAFVEQVGARVPLARALFRSEAP